MTEDIPENRRAKFYSRDLPAPITVAQLRQQLADLPDDMVLSYDSYETPEFHDWYTDVLHVVGVTDEGKLQLGSNADYILDDERFEDEDEDDDESEDHEARGEQQRAVALDSTDPGIGPDGLRGWERELLAASGFATDDPDEDAPPAGPGAAIARVWPHPVTVGSNTSVVTAKAIWTK